MSYIGILGHNFKYMYLHTLLSLLNQNLQRGLQICIFSKLCQVIMMPENNRSSQVSLRSHLSFVQPAPFIIGGLDQKEDRVTDSYLLKTPTFLFRRQTRDKSMQNAVWLYSLSSLSPSPYRHCRLRGRVEMPIQVATAVRKDNGPMKCSFFPLFFTWSSPSQCQGVLDRCLAYL